MARESYATRLRAALSDAPPKKKCCAHAMRDAAQILQEPEGASRAAAIAAYPAHAKCSACLPHFIRALFLACGSVTDPEKRNHLEFAFRTPEERAALAALLKARGIPCKAGARKGRYLLYLKDGEAIADFLAYIGANSAAFDFMNRRIEREFRNNINRQVNCDTANITKTLSVSRRQIERIRKMEQSGALGRLPEELRETARLRIENEQMSLKELGEAHDPPITKSGVTHRLAKIEAAAAALETEAEKEEDEED